MIEKKPDRIDMWDSLSKVFWNSRKMIERGLENLGIKTIDLKVLFLLDRDGPKSIVSLAYDTYVSGPWITGIVDELVKRSFVKKVRSKVDRRVVRVSITEKGKTLLDEGIKIYKKLIGTVLEDLSDGEILEFTETLKKIEKAIGKT